MIGVSVVITTHNRTRVAEETVSFMARNFKYPNVKWIISDDRSDAGHVESLVKKFNSCGIEDVTVCRTDEKRYGLGASLNNGLEEAFKFSDIVLTMEDDWILEKPFNPAYYIKFLSESKDVSCIRLAAINHSETVEFDGYFDKVVAGKSQNDWSTFNLQVALRKRSIYDKLGYYMENCGPDKVELDFVSRYNKHTNGGFDRDFTLIPRFIRHHTLDDRSLIFTHVGKSTVGHNEFDVPERFSYLYDSRKQPEKQVFFKIVVPTYNSKRFIGRCLDSILGQTFRDFSVMVVDDCSTDGTWGEIERFVAMDDRIFSYRMPTNSYSGKCRNWGIDNGPPGRYVLFLDSDDMYSDNTSLRRIYDAITANNFPDVVKCSFRYVNLKNGHKRRVIFRNRLDSIVRYNAPWTMASSFQTCSRFVEGRKKFNDVVWSLRTIESAKSWAVVGSPVVDYHINENPISLQYGKDRNDIQSILSIYQLVHDLGKLKFGKPILEEIKDIHLREKNGMLKALMMNPETKERVEEAKRLFEGEKHGCN